jgi:hypothetical protein
MKDKVMEYNKLTTGTTSSELERFQRALLLEKRSLSLLLAME